MVIIEKASTAWKLLNGVFCVYKPSHIEFHKVPFMIKQKLLDELNIMPRDLGPGLIKVLPAGNPDISSLESSSLNKSETNSLTVSEASVAERREAYEIVHVPDLRRHPLLTGPGFRLSDLKVQVAGGGVNEMAGVTPVGIGAGCGVLGKITKRNPVCAYHLTGKFGLRTHDYRETGHIYEKTTFGHLTQGRFEKFLAMYQGQFQGRILEAYGVDPESQAAYELRSRGLVRPRDESHQLIYQIRCIEWDLPYFTLEIHCINETDLFLMKIVSDIAEDCKTGAVVTKMRRIRWGNYTLDHALVHDQINVGSVIGNIQECAVATTRELRMRDQPFLQRIRDERPEEKDRIPSVLRSVRE